MKEPDGEWIARMRGRSLVAEALLDLYPALVRHAQHQGRLHAWRPEASKAAAS